MLNSTRRRFIRGCAFGFLGVALTCPVFGQSLGEGAAGDELQQGWQQLLEEEARAEEDAALLGLPLVSVTASDSTAAEPNDPGAFTITRSGVLAGPLERMLVRGSYGPSAANAKLK